MFDELSQAIRILPRKDKQEKTDRIKEMPSYCCCIGVAYEARIKRERATAHYKKTIDGKKQEKVPCQKSGKRFCSICSSSPKSTARAQIWMGVVSHYKSFDQC
jgi:hypothetical protein